MAEQDLDDADVDVLVQEVGRKAVAQRVRRHPLGDLGHVSGGMNGAIELTRRERIDPVGPGEQPDLGVSLSEPAFMCWWEPSWLRQVARRHGRSLWLVFSPP